MKEYVDSVQLRNDIEVTDLGVWQQTAKDLDLLDGRYNCMIKATDVS